MKIFTPLFVTVFFVTITSHAQISLGIRGGYINTGLESSGNGYAPGTQKTDSWQAGIYTNIPLFKNGYLQPGVSYVEKGAGLDYAVSHPVNLFTSGVTKLKLQYLELPVHLVYKVPVGFGKLLVGAGPYAAYCMRGDYSVSAYNDNKLVQSGSKRVDFKASPNIFGTNMNLQRWDAGLNFIAGLELNCCLSLSAQYGYGMVDIDQSPENNYKNRYWGVSLGFFFDREDW
ncbi:MULTISPECIES: outer membrane beta-barrel protein [unclassified Chitinophaga]|uniref:outer membrane beta-barrel protein n=1 Tax=unclassified Chitinophaga TaxID=2619133 RepID=UPI00300FB7E2